MAQGEAGAGAGELASADDGDAVDEDFVKAGGVVVGVAKPGRGLHGGKVEDDEIGDKAGPDLAALRQGKGARWQGGHFAHGFLE